MDPDVLLWIAMAGTGVWWAPMIVAPGAPWTTRWVRSPLVVMVPCVLYTALVIANAPVLWPSVLTPSNETIGAWFDTPYGVFVGTAHYLAVDLFVGRWLFFDLSERGAPRWQISAWLLLCLMLCPLCLTLYLPLRALGDRQA